MPPMGAEAVGGGEQGDGLFVGVGADVLPLAGAIVLGGMDKVEVAELTVAIPASVGGGQDRLEPFKTAASLTATVPTSYWVTNSQR